MGRTPEYYAWRDAIRRCTNPSDKWWPHYGGRGINVCNHWLASFADFLADMGPRPSSKHSIDRIDVNGDYEPSNCRWATPSEQQSNKRPYPLRRGTLGATLHKSGKWQAQANAKGMRTYLGLFDTAEEASAAYHTARARARP